jgi:hypothetical protein
VTTVKGRGTRLTGLQVYSLVVSEVFFGREGVRWDKSILEIKERRGRWVTNPRTGHETWVVKFYYSSALAFETLVAGVRAWKYRGLNSPVFMSPLANRHKARPPQKFSQNDLL